MYENALKPWHLIVLVLVFVVLFGSKKLPEAARGLGRSLRILKAELSADDDATPTPEPTAERPTKPPTPPTNS